MKLQLKHLSVYLPHKLNVQYLDRDNDIFKIRELSIDTYPYLINQTQFKPILRPMSDLTSEDFQLKYLYFELIGTNSELYGSFEEFTDFVYETTPEYLPFIVFNQLIKWKYDCFSLIKEGLAIDRHTLK